MSDNAARDVGIALKLVLGKRMKEALLAGNTEEAVKLAAKLQEAEDLEAANPSRRATQADAPQKNMRRPTAKSKDASGEWIN
jgi:hypothetical protein